MTTHYVGWRDWAEWAEVSEALFPGSAAHGAEGGARSGPRKGLLEPCTPGSPRLLQAHVNEIGDALQRWRGAVVLMRTWRAKQASMPAMVETTWTLLQATLLDWDNDLGQRERAGVADVYAVQLAYAMAVIRMVNAVVDDMQKGAFAQSILDLGERAGLPRWVVELRHEATHGASLPSLQMLRLAVDSLFEWVRGKYWGPQGREAFASHKTMSRSDAACDAGVQKLAELVLGGGSTDEADDCVDRIAAEVPPKLLRDSLVPRFVSLLTSPRNGSVPGPHNPLAFHRWERVLAGFDDAYSGFTPAILDELCTAACDVPRRIALAAEQAAHVGPGPTSSSGVAMGRVSKRQRRESEAATGEVRGAAEASSPLVVVEEQRAAQTIAWIKYFVSRRWHSLGDEALAIYERSSRSRSPSKTSKSKDSGPVNLAVLHPSNWTKAQAAWILGAAPPNMHSAAVLLRALRRAFADPHPWAQRVVAGVLPALCINTTGVALGTATDLIRSKLGVTNGLAAARTEVVAIEDLEAFCGGGVAQAGPWRSALHWHPCPIGEVGEEDSFHLETSRRGQTLEGDDESSSADSAASEAEDDAIIEEAPFCDEAVAAAAAKQAQLLF